MCNGKGISLWKNECPKYAVGVMKTIVADTNEKIAL
jgi:hypothetical protein